MSALIRPSIHALTLVMLACACMLVAQTVNTVLSISLLPLPSASERQKEPTVSQASTASLSTELLARYTGLELNERPAPPAITSDTAQASQLALKLLGTMPSTSPGMSMASVYEDPTRRTRTVWVGSTTLGAEVLSIERTRIMLSNGGRVELLDITSGPPAPGMAAVLPPTSSAPPSGFGSTLRQTGPEAYAIQRQDVDNTLAHLNDIAMQARIVPSFSGGVARGFKLFAMKPDSIYARLGMQNGDILQRINGFTLDNPTRALEAYSHLKGSSRIELEIERNGQPLRKTYTVEN